MFKKYGFILLISIILCILQQSIFSRIVIMGYSFDIIFIFIICFALLNSKIESFILAIMCGLIRDSFFPYIFGVNSILFILSVFIITQVNQRIFKDAVVIPITLSLVLSVFKSLLYFGYFYIASIKFDFFEKTLNIMIFESIFNAVASIFIYRFVKRLMNFKIMQQEWKF